ncbi:hypothetical protein SH668x_003146 [Planctomicrobium sp. SH668]|uniref:hypothetical protein n=1 Tax=Planctomicrobium sp. SH668 TaxID=3448126 RepID=UPI003F5B7486
MEAIAKRVGAFLALCLLTTAAQAATYKTANFVVTATSDDVARRVANCAEYWRNELAIQWLGKALPNNWSHPCPITVQVTNGGAGGQTTFTFENGEVYGWKMQVEGSLERILDSVIPHEVNHTIFASHFRRPMPRWADEGAASLIEHESEQAQQIHRLNRVMNTPKQIPLKDLLAIREYPADMQDVLTLYAEGFSLASFLVGLRGEDGRRVYMNFLEDAHRNGWEAAIKRNYGYESVAQLEQYWSKWILAGSPPLQPIGTSIASNETPATEATARVAVAAHQADLTDAPLANYGENNNVVIRSQSPQEETPVKATSSRLSPDPLPAIQRPLRSVRQTELSAMSNEKVAQASQNESGSSEGEDFRPRMLRDKSAPDSGRPANLSPTTEVINVNPKSSSYAFPEARRQ